MEKIYLSEEDTTDIILDKIRNSAEKEIDLIVLSQTNSVLSIVNLKLFKELADSLGKTIFISTNDDAVKILSEKSRVKISVMPEQEKINSPVKEPVGFKMTDENHMNNFNKSYRSVDSVTPIKRNSFGASPNYASMPLTGKYPGKNAVKEYSAKDTAEFNVSGTNKRLFLLFISMAVLAVGALAYFLLPTAQVLITPKTEPMSVKFDFVLDKKAGVLNKDEKIVPATAIVADIEKSGEFNATGKKEVFAKAGGIITIYNECFTTPITLKANNQVVSANGKIYYTSQGAVVPPMVVEDGNVIAGSIDVPVIAGAAGPQFNIEPMDFTLPAVKIKYKCQKIYAKSAAPFLGGAIGFTTVVSEADIKKAEDFLAEEAKKEAIKQLEDKKPADLVLLPDAISVKKNDLAVSVKADQVANKFKANIKISAIAFLFNADYVKEIASGLFKDAKENKKDINFSDSFEADYANISVLGPDKMQMTVSARSFAYQSIDANSVKTKMLGKTKDELEDFKNNSPEIDKIKITLWPFWVKKIPSIERNVSVNILLDSSSAE